MFGFTRVRHRGLTEAEILEFRTYYCGLCHTLRDEFNLPAALLTGRDATLLALLVGAQQKHSHATLSTRCPARLGLSRRPRTGDKVSGRYAAAVSILLLWGKLEDNIHDENSLLAQVLRGLTRRHFCHAEAILLELGFPMERLKSLRESQQLVEADVAQRDLDSITDPSAHALGTILSHTATLTDNFGNCEPLTEIGKCFGRLIIVLDACEDYARDSRRKRYNAIAASLGRHGTPGGLSGAEYRDIELFLLLQLQNIRGHSLGLSLQRHHRLVGNILCAGLFDSTTRACEALRKSVDPKSDLSLTPINCSGCGHVVRGQFCGHCGARREVLGRLSVN